MKKKKQKTNPKERKKQTNKPKEKLYEGYLVIYAMFLTVPSCCCESSGKPHSFFSQHTKAGNGDGVCEAPWDLWVKNANCMLTIFFLFCCFKRWKGTAFQENFGKPFVPCCVPYLCLSLLYNYFLSLKSLDILCYSLLCIVFIVYQAQRSSHPY